MINLGGLEILVTVVYASNSREDRKEVWKTLVDLANSSNDIKWRALGDFKEVRSPENRMGKISYSHGGPSEFILAKDKAHLMELPSIGGYFTWSKCPTTHLGRDTPKIS